LQLLSIIEPKFSGKEFIQTKNCGNSHQTLTN